jgi:hypothetical protein
MIITNPYRCQLAILKGTDPGPGVKPSNGKEKEALRILTHPTAIKSKTFFNVIPPSKTKPENGIGWMDPSRGMSVVRCEAGNRRRSEQTGTK